MFFIVLASVRRVTLKSVIETPSLQQRWIHLLNYADTILSSHALVNATCKHRPIDISEEDIRSQTTHTRSITECGSMTGLPGVLAITGNTTIMCYLGSYSIIIMYSLISHSDRGLELRSQGAIFLT